jgi:membrane protease YdiL (CAAX protease family)
MFLKQRHPFQTLLLLLVWTVAGAFVMILLTLLILWLIKGSVVFSGMLPGQSFEQMDIVSMKWLQLGSSIGMFILPPILLGLTSDPKERYYEWSGRLTPLLFLMVGAMLFAFAPIMNWIIELNSQLRLPESWAALEEWILIKEKEMEQLTTLFLKDTRLSDLFLNLLVMAVAPAIGEELFFRGALQKIAMQWFGNPHVAIWVISILFSAIHMQFMGFFPRFILGLLFGYLYFWSNNLWLPIFAHFVNNATVVIAAFVLQRKGKSIDDVGFEEQLPLHLYAVCALVSVLLLYQFWKQTRVANRQNNGEKLG